MLFVPPAGSLKPTIRFEDSEFVANKAGFGPAVYAMFGQVDLRFKRCLFRCVSLLLDLRAVLNAAACGLHAETISRIVLAGPLLSWVRLR